MLPRPGRSRDATARTPALAVRACAGRAVLEYCAGVDRRGGLEAGVVLVDVDDDLICPKCSGQTDPVNYGGDSGIIIERCTDCHGVWLDGDRPEDGAALLLKTETR